MTFPDFSLGCSVPRGVAALWASIRREAYLALKKVHKDSGHAGNIVGCRACKGALQKLDA